MGKNIYISEDERDAISNASEVLRDQIEAGCSSEFHKEIQKDMNLLDSILKKYLNKKVSKQQIVKKALKLSEKRYNAIT
jgi:hypothetical protein